MGVLEARISQPEVVKPTIETLAADADTQTGHIGEIRQAHPAGLVDLTENHLLVRAMQRPPGSDTALQGAADAFRQIDMAALVDPLRGSTFEDGDRAKVWRRRQHRDHLSVEEFGERVGAAAASCLLFM